MIAHRGHGATYQQNKKTAIEKAILLNFDIIELDLQLCKTGEIILNHDIHLDGEFIKDLTLYEIRIKDPNILTLEELFEIDKIYEQNLYFDLKGENFDGIKSKLVEKLFASLCFLEVKSSNIWIGSFNLYQIHEMIRWKMHNYYKIGLITSNHLDYDFIDEISPFISFVSLEISSLNTLVINKLKEMNIFVIAFTCHNQDDFSLIQHFEVNGICTDIFIPKSK